MIQMIKTTECCDCCGKTGVVNKIIARRPDAPYDYIRLCPECQEDLRQLLNLRSSRTVRSRAVRYVPAIN